MTTIPGLPEHIREVPPPPVSPDDPEADAKRAAWLAWRAEVLRWRADRIPRINADPVLQTIERALCAQHPAYWLTAWGWIFEPRAERGGGDKAFVPFAVQVELLDFFLATMTKKGHEADAAVSKSRDMGASWVMCAFALWGWLFENPWQVRLVSYMQDLVDKGYQKQPDSLFWKIDYLHDHLPPWIRPTGFDPKVHRQILHMQNPVNGNVIAGYSSTSKSGRGGRSTWIGYDEFAMFEDGDDSWSSTTNTTEHRFAVSSEHLEYGDHFYRLFRGDAESGVRVSPLAMDWWQHPLHDDVWLGEIKDRFKSEGRIAAFYREVLRDPKKGTSTWVYPDAADIRPNPDVRYRPQDSVFVSIDPGFSGATAIVWAQEHPDGFIDIIEGYQNFRLSAEFYGSILSGELKSGVWDYSEEDEQLAAWCRTLIGPTYFGDTYGHSVHGASMDSFYDNLKPFGINVNRDRRPDDPERRIAFMVEVRYHPGRQQAVRQAIPRLRFADTPGARRVLRAVQNYRFPNSDRPRSSDPKSPLIDDSSHYATALEFLIANLKMRKQAHMRTWAKPTRARLMPQLPTGPRWPTQNRMVG